MLRNALCWMLAVSHACCSQHGTRDDLATVRQLQAFVSRIQADSSHFEWHQKLCAQPLRLGHGAACEISSAYAGGKSKIVFNPRTRTRLPTGGVPVKQQSAQAFGSAIHGSSQPRRTGADNHQVVN